jgi:hypothetical protein
MRKVLVLGALVLVCSMGFALAPPSNEVSAPGSAIFRLSQADAALGRGGAGNQAGGRPGVLSRLASLAQSELAAIFFIVVALFLAVPIFQRNAGAAVALLVASFVIGAFLLVPQQVETLFRSIYQYVL